ncbi:MAG: hypothetical protein K2F77_05220 [Muribaculaceae bacterium]|nr:hypothetical protein [Muribaculaceae bacterium]
MTHENELILAAARDAWLAAAPLRRQRLRCKRYTYGDQWHDAMPGHPAEGDLARLAGRRPLTNNLIRQLVKTVVGRFRAMAEERKTYVAPPGSDVVRNQLAEIDSRMLEEFLISGVAVQRVVSERRMQGAGVWVDNVSPERFFTNAFRDPRGFDIEMAGMLHDMSPAELLARFAGADAHKAERLRRIYSADDIAAPGYTAATVDFFTPAPGRWRAIEVWTLDAVTPRRERAARKTATPTRAAAQFVWQCRWLAPDGTMLASYPSPFAHGMHPFAVKYYPLTDGEVHPFVADLLDQQRCINRLITMIDHIMNCSAKGVLLYPVDQLVEGMTWEQVADTWSATDGIIPIARSDRPLPQQIAAGGGADGAYRLLSLQMKLFDDISGVGAALTGHDTSGAAKGANMYEAQVRNATIALYDLFLSFDAFRQQRDYKMKNC